MKWECKSQDTETTSQGHRQGRGPGKVWFTTTQEDPDPRLAFMRHIYAYVRQLQYPGKYRLFDSYLMFHTIISERIDLYETDRNRENHWRYLEAGRTKLFAMEANDDDLHRHEIRRVSNK